VIQGGPTSGGALGQTGLGPFLDTHYNDGPVGPVLAPMGPGGLATFNRTTAGNHAACLPPDLCVWVANWLQNGDVYLLKGTNCQAGYKTCPGSVCTWTATEFTQAEATNRITAMTWARLHNNYWVLGQNVDALVNFSQSVTPQGADVRVRFVATEGGFPTVGFNGCGGQCKQPLYGLLLSNRPYNIGYQIDTNGVAQPAIDVNQSCLAPYHPIHPKYGVSPQNPCPNNDPTCEDFIKSVVSASADPFFGDIYFEVEDLSGHDEVLFMRGDDYSIHNLYDVAVEQKLCKPNGDQNCTPGTAWGFLPGQGKISAASSVKVQRMQLNFGGLPTYYDLPIVQ
jgi:hypothetical protein